MGEIHEIRRTAARRGARTCRLLYAPGLTGPLYAKNGPAAGEAHRALEPVASKGQKARAVEPLGQQLVQQRGVARALRSRPTRSLSGGCRCDETQDLSGSEKRRREHKADSGGAQGGDPRCGRGRAPGRGHLWRASIPRPVRPRGDSRSGLPAIPFSASAKGTQAGGAPVTVRISTAAKDPGFEQIPGIG